MATPSPKENPSRLYLLAGIIVLVLGLIVVWQVMPDTPTSAQSRNTAETTQATPAPPATEPEQSPPSLTPPLPTSTLPPFVSRAMNSRGGVNLAEPPLHLMDGYAAKDVTPAGDIAILQDTLQHFLEAVPARARPPLGSNEEYTRALSGDNMRRIAFVPPDFPQIVDDQLVDRWGTPVFFHNVSENIVELRSAGPDRKMWTSDDVFTPPANTAKYHLNGP